MLNTQWTDAARTYIVCVDSYDEGVLKGRLWDPARDAQGFSSLSQFLLKMEQLLDEEQMPQAFTRQRRFRQTPQPAEYPLPEDKPRGGCCTFELRVIFRQNSSWQGILKWRETRKEQNFRSVLELVSLMDSALKSPAGNARG